MPIEDLEQLGYQISRTSPDMMPAMATVFGYGQQWNLMPDIPGQKSEDEVVAEAQNHKKLYDKLTQMQQYFGDAYSNWPTMTNAQKDVAMRNAMRALSNLTRHVRNDLTSEGV
jgi:hypothetical protein